MRDLEEQKALMIAVSTGGPRIQEKNHEYTERRLRIKIALSELGLEDPNLFSDLWGWYGKWSSGELPSWGSRRKYIAELYTPTIDAITARKLGKMDAVVAEPTGWNRVDRGLDKIRSGVESGKNEEDFQAVGLYCRETLISAAQEVFNPFLHCPNADEFPSPTDSFRMLDFYFSKELEGGSNEVLRGYAKATIKLANQVVHKRTVDFKEALICAEATRAAVNIVSIISGKRDKK
jgi:hypothetical protein